MSNIHIPESYKVSKHYFVAVLATKQDWEWFTFSLSCLIAAACSSVSIFARYLAMAVYGDGCQMIFLSLCSIVFIMVFWGNGLQIYEKIREIQSWHSP